MSPKKRKETFVPGFGNRRGRPRAHGYDAARSRRETIRRRNVTQIYLLDAHGDWVTQKATWDVEQGKFTTNAEFAKHLLTDHGHRCSPQYMCSVHTQTESSDDDEVISQSTRAMFASVLTSTPIKNDSGMPCYGPSTSFRDENLQSLKREREMAETSCSVEQMEGQDTDEEENITWTEAVQPLHESGIPIENLETSCTEEDVFHLGDDGNDEDDGDDNEDGTEAAAAEKQLASLEGVKAIVWVDKILQLLQDVNGMVCTHPLCTRELIYSTKFHGSALVITWKCEQKYHPKGTWCSQPKLRGMYAGNLQLAAGIVVSGNSFSKVQHFFRSLNLKGILKDTFYRVQKLYVAPAVSEMWDKMQDTLLTSLKDKEIVLSGDARNDSPGHSAQYCTYTMMEETSGKVLHMEVVDVREAGGKSPNMEKIGFTRSMDYLMERATVKEVVTDGHIQIAALMRNSTKYEGIVHQNDVWHGSKSLTKMVTKAAKAKENKALDAWMPSIRKHFWFSSKNCNGDEKALKASLLGMLHHVVNEHEWALGAYGFPGKCAHEEIEEPDKAWLTKGSPPHKTLGKLLTSKHFMKKLPYYRNFRHTGSLESFHKHLLMYAPKRHSYGYIGFTTRSKLAAIDNNYHTNRKQAVTKEGKLRYRCKYSKRTRNFHAEPLPEAKTYGYLPELMRDIAAKRLTTPGHLSQHVSLAQDDPRRIHPRMSMLPRSSLDVLVHEHLSRFSGEKSSGQHENKTV